MSNDSDTANKLLIEKFKTALNPELVQKIIQSKKRPTKIEEWYDKAMSFDRSYRLAMAIRGPSQLNARFIPRSAPKRDLFAMDMQTTSRSGTGRSPVPGPLCSLPYPHYEAVRAGSTHLWVLPALIR
ncbi:hypothetical protein CVT25_003749 [Psilocybe cyanescens]|uniref:Uncharacterized protein n=1 Tax=Psilocybe cyanescens TaxID=93625 RepID=A0A409XIT0_PSICY|nr:hypothetical protein CVT25_003749 [Psilocybe cyanescens]